MGKTKTNPAPAIRDRVKEFRRVKASELAPNPKNWRTHPETQLAAMRGVLNEIGFAGAELARELPDGSLQLIDGHARAEIAGDSIIPVLVLDVNEAEADKILATFDPLGAMAEADAGKLDELLRSVETGDEALAKMLADLAKDAGLYLPPEIVEDEVPEVPVEPITKPGDLWLLGEHRLLCGDSTKAESVARVMGGDRVDACITDPPYGINFDTDYTRFTPPKSTRFYGKNKKHAPVHGDSKKFDPTPYLDFDAVVLFGANYYADRLPIGTWLVWDKRFANGKAWLSDAELAWMKSGEGVYIFSLTSQGMVRPESVQHPTQKAVVLIAWCIEKSKAGKIIFDPFIGSGTTIIAAEQLNRRCFGIEISPNYCDVCVTRWEHLTGRKAQLST